jgi:lia operon protein LiaG
VATGSGDIDARDVDGDQIFETGSGSLHASHLHGGAVKVDTGSGDVTVESVQATNLKAQTGSGELAMTDVAASEVILGTGSGDVSVQLSRRIDRLKVTTGSGGVRITAPPDLGAALRVSTGSGDVESDFPLSRVQRGSGSLVATLGDGRGDISVSTGSGNVTLVRR